MLSKIKKLLPELALSVGALLATFLILEYLVFGLILKPDDLLENVTVNGVVRYKPDTRAIFRHPGAHETLVSINSDGWNSTHASYNLKKSPGRVRIAVIGDSYVHGAFVDVNQGFPHLIETNLNASGRDAEVYRFGMDGAPLSQYLNVLRREVLSFRPDVVVVPLIHNDFDESYRFLKSRYASSFLKLTRDPAGQAIEIAPTDFKPGLSDRFRRFATFRYLYYETGLYLKLKGLVSSLFWGGDEKYAPEFIQSAVDIRKIKDHTSNRFFTRYVLAEMKKLADQNGFKLVFVMDGVREAIYESKKQSDYEVGKLNALAAELAHELNLKFLDLQDAFALEYANTQTRFEYPYDWHWNAPANALVAREITSLLLNDTELFGPLSKDTGSSARLQKQKPETPTNVDG